MGDRPENRLLSLSPSQSTRLWLELARAQVARRRAADLVRQFEQDPFVEPAPVDQRDLHRLDGLWLDAAEGYDAVQLSPVAPLGSCSVVAPTSQDRTLTANRGTEVVSDPTNVLALECARRLRQLPAQSSTESPTESTDLSTVPARVRLSTVHQVLRAQKLPPVDGYTQHFRLACLMEAGPALASDRFEVEAVVRALGVFETVLEAASATQNLVPPPRHATVRADPDSPLAERVCAGVRSAFPLLEVRTAAPPSSYYQGLRVTLDVTTASGDALPLGDIGRFDWLAQLCSNRKMRCIAAGFGLQLLLALGETAPGAGNA